MFNADISFAFQLSNPKTLCSKQKICFAVICKFLVNFWEEIVFLKGLVKFGEIMNIEDLFCILN